MNIEEIDNRLKYLEILHMECSTHMAINDLEVLEKLCEQYDSDDQINAIAYLHHDDEIRGISKYVSELSKKLLTLSEKIDKQYNKSKSYKYK